MTEEKVDQVGRVETAADAQELFLCWDDEDIYEAFRSLANINNYHLEVLRGLASHVSSCEGADGATEAFIALDIDAEDPTRIDVLHVLYWDHGERPGVVHYEGDQVVRDTSETATDYGEIHSLSVPLEDWWHFVDESVPLPVKEYPIEGEVELYRVEHYGENADKLNEVIMNALNEAAIKDQKEPNGWIVRAIIKALGSQRSVLHRAEVFADIKQAVMTNRGAMDRLIQSSSNSKLNHHLER